MTTVPLTDWCVQVFLSTDWYQGGLGDLYLAKHGCELCIQIFVSTDRFESGLGSFTLLQCGCFLCVQVPLSTDYSICKSGCGTFTWLLYGCLLCVLVSLSTDYSTYENLTVATPSLGFSSAFGNMQSYSIQFLPLKSRKSSRINY